MKTNRTCIACGEGMTYGVVEYKRFTSLPKIKALIGAHKCHCCAHSTTLGTDIAAADRSMACQIIEEDLVDQLSEKDKQFLDKMIRHKLI